MCTVTWCRGEHQLDVFFNRDERRTRPIATPPQVATIGSMRVVAPRDPVGNGTWLGFNTRGLVVGILNHYAADDARHVSGDGKRRSRGLLVMELLASSEPASFSEQIMDVACSCYPPFLLVGWSLAGVAGWCWDGAACTPLKLEAPGPVSTSSFRSREVVASRRARLRTYLHGRSTIDPAVLAAYHRDRDPRGGAYSVLMDREDARTMSVSHIRMTAGNAAFNYSPVAADAPQVAATTRVESSW